MGFKFRVFCNFYILESLFALGVLGLGGGIAVAAAAIGAALLSRRR